jgi:hypothetical protein
MAQGAERAPSFDSDCNIRYNRSQWFSAWPVAEWDRPASCPAKEVEWLQGGGTGYEAVAWFVSINKLEDPNNLPLVRTMLFEYVPPPTSPSVLTTPGWYWANTDPMPASAD